MAVANPEKAFWPFVFTLEIPERPEDIAKRHHNKYAKEAMRETLEQYQDTFTPKKFKRGNKARYNYKPRSTKYNRRKQRLFNRPPVAMVFSGTSRRDMTRIFRIRIGGTAEKKTLRGFLILRFPWNKSGRFRRGGSARQIQRRATAMQLVEELERFAQDEPAKVAEWFGRNYFRKVENHRKTRKRVRIT